ncbi:DUF4350 domain-containing protein [Microbacterium sp. NPDC055903]
MSTVQDPASATTAAPRRSPVTRWIAWALLCALVIGGAFVVARVNDVLSIPTRGALDPESAGRDGALALVEILRDQGVEVQVVRSRISAADALREGSTLAMTDPYALSDEAVRAMIAPADRVVVLSVSARMLRLLDLGEDSFSSASGAVEASCDLPEVSEVGRIRPDRLIVPGPGVTGCFAESDGASALLQTDREGASVSIIEASRLVSNGFLAEDGNAALGLALLGQSDHVVWYVPSFLDGDLEAQSEPSLGDLTPAWVTPAILLLVAALIAAAIWRGRRFGPLVAETLPVTVRASETMHGRARLTAKAADSGHAADALREGAIRRLARRLGLHERSSAGEVADASADRLRVPRSDVAELLSGSPPPDDEALVRLARRIADLEAAVEAASQDGRRRP